MTYTPRLTPYEHQVRGVDKCNGDNGFAYLAEMGTGKSAMLLLDWGRLYDANEVDDFLLVAPAGVYRNWEGEVNSHMDPEVRERARVFTWRAGGGVAFRRELEHFLRHPDRSRPRIFLTNSESYQTNTGLAVAAREFLRGRRGMVAVDESTLMKNHRAERTKKIVALKYDAPFRRIAAGLPNPNSPLDLYSQFEFLDRRFLGHANFHTYQSHFCITKKVEVRKPGGSPVLNKDGTIKKRTEVVSFRNLEELKARVAAHSFRVTKDECLDLPPKVYMPIREVQMHPEQRRVYESIKKNAVAVLGDGSRVTSQQVITQLLRMQQVLCGHAVDEAGVLHEVPEYRTDALVEEADAVGGKAIIWTIYRHSLMKLRDRLRREFGERSVVMYYGDTPSDERQEAIHRFQNDSETLFFLSNQQTGGRGITLTAARAVIYHSNSPDLELRLQSEDRAHRAGLDHSVAYSDLSVPGSIDTRWVRALRNKMDVASTVLGDGIRNWLV